MIIDFSEKSTLEIKNILKQNGYVFFEKDIDLKNYRDFCIQYGDILIHRDSNEYGITIVQNRSKNQEGFFYG